MQTLKVVRYYKLYINHNSISIEMCNSKTRNIKVENNTIKLVKFLMDKYNVPAENVIRHYDVTGKQCPLTMLDDAIWNGFKKKLK